MTPVECARHGYELIEAHILKCVACGEILSGRLASSDLECARDRSAKILEQKLTAKHTRFCPFSSLASSPSFCDPVVEEPVVLDNFVQSVRTISKYGAAVPRFTQRSKDRIVGGRKQLLEWLVNQVGGGDGGSGREIVESRVLLGLAGWTICGGDPIVTIECKVCNRKKGSWLYYNFGTPMPPEEQIREIFPDEADLIVAGTLEEVVREEISRLAQEVVDDMRTAERDRIRQSESGGKEQVQEVEITESVEAAKETPEASPPSPPDHPEPTSEENPASGILEEAPDMEPDVPEAVEPEQPSAASDSREKENPSADGFSLENPLFSKLNQDNSSEINSHEPKSSAFGSPKNLSPPGESVQEEDPKTPKGNGYGNSPATGTAPCTMTPNSRAAELRFVMKSFFSNQANSNLVGAGDQEMATDSRSLDRAAEKNADELEQELEIAPPHSDPPIPVPNAMSDTAPTVTEKNAGDNPDSDALPHPVQIAEDASSPTNTKEEDVEEIRLHLDSSIEEVDEPGNSKEIAPSASDALLPNPEDDVPHSVEEVEDKSSPTKAGDEDAGESGLPMESSSASEEAPSVTEKNDEGNQDNDAGGSPIMQIAVRSSSEEDALSDEVDEDASTEPDDEKANADDIPDELKRYYKVREPEYSEESDDAEADEEDVNLADESAGDEEEEAEEDEYDDTDQDMGSNDDEEEEEQPSPSQKKAYDSDSDVVVISSSDEEDSKEVQGEAEQPPLDDDNEEDDDPIPNLGGTSDPVLVNGGGTQSSSNSSPPKSGNMWFHPLDHLPWCTWLRPTTFDPSLTGSMALLLKLEEVMEKERASAAGNNEEESAFDANNRGEDAVQSASATLSPEGKLKKIKDMLNSV